MVRRLLVPLHLLFIVASSLCAQDSQVSLCVVETKVRPEIQYDPSAGPLAIDLYKQLSEKKLFDGSPLKLTVLPASDQKDIVPEIARLQCSWVLQLWRIYINQFSSPVVGYDDVYFSLWNGVTRKTIAKGTVVFRPQNPRSRIRNAAAPFAALADKVLDQLNKHH